MKINWKKLIVIIILTFLIGSIFAFFTVNGMDTYKQLEKPFEIPAVIFPIVWSILYLLMSISYYMITKSRSKDKEPALYLYWIQLAVNSLWTLIFFGLKAYLFAFIWEVLLIILVVLMILKFIKINKVAAYLNIPYLIWLFFAGYLNLMIYILNK